jgi:hypothetical protein
MTLMSRLGKDSSEFGLKLQQCVIGIREHASRFEYLIFTAAFLSLQGPAPSSEWISCPTCPQSTGTRESTRICQYTS